MKGSKGETAATIIRLTKEGERKQIGQVEPERKREARKEIAATTIWSTRKGERKQVE